MASVSGLTRDERIHCRDRVIQAAELAWQNAEDVHYTQGGKRWNGIRNNRDARLGKFPHWADCSSFVTWCLWNGMFLKYELPDTVNGLNWTAGNTGSLLQGGKKITDVEKVLRGDLVFYGSPRHVSIVYGRKNGHPMVISHGSEGAPFYVRFDYRTVTQIRRYI
jgi:cell wall-associated NlpC family hydrolase